MTRTTFFSFTFCLRSLGLYCLLLLRRTTERHWLNSVIVHASGKLQNCKVKTSSDYQTLTVCKIDKEFVHSLQNPCQIVI